MYSYLGNNCFFPANCESKDLAKVQLKSRESLISILTTTDASSWLCEVSHNYVGIPTLVWSMSALEIYFMQLKNPPSY